MSVEDVNTVDMVATRPDSNEVRLVLTDHLSWDDCDRHCLLLQEKLNTYIAFVQSGIAFVQSGQLLRIKEPKIPASPQLVIWPFPRWRPAPMLHPFSKTPGSSSKKGGLASKWN